MTKLKFVKDALDPEMWTQYVRSSYHQRNSWYMMGMVHVDVLGEFVDLDSIESRSDGPVDSFEITLSITDISL